MKYGFAMEMRGGAAAIRGREGKHIVSNAECLEAGLGRMERRWRLCGSGWHSVQPLVPLQQFTIGEKIWSQSVTTL